MGKAAENYLLATVAALSWLSVESLALSPLVCWNISAQPKKVIFLRFFLYHLLVTFGVLLGAFSFYPSMSAALLPLPYFLWLALCSLPWMLLTEQGPTGGPSAPKALVVFLITALPPVGIFCWANPLLAAGALFPNTGLMGLALTGVLVWALSKSQHGNRDKLLLASLLSLSVVLNAFSLPASSTFIREVNTKLGSLPDDFFLHATRQAELSALLPVGQVLALPENISGDWNQGARNFWEAQERATGSIVLLGGLRREAQKMFTSYGQPAGQRVDAKIPMPLGSWAPFDDTSSRLNLFGSSVLKIQDSRALVLVCYESAILYSGLVELVRGERVDLVIAPSNLWWDSSGFAEVPLRTAAKSWARLLGVALVRPVNRGVS